MLEPIVWKGLLPNIFFYEYSAPIVTSLGPGSKLESRARCELLVWKAAETPWHMLLLLRASFLTSFTSLLGC